jgi:hypothetical protein
VFGEEVERQGEKVATCDRNSYESKLLPPNSLDLGCSSEDLQHMDDGQPVDSIFFWRTEGAQEDSDLRAGLLHFSAINQLQLYQKFLPSEK